MSDDGTPIDYESLYKQAIAERDSYSKTLGEYVDMNNKLRADLKVAQEVAKRTVGTSTVNPVDEQKPKSLSDVLKQYKHDMIKG